MDGQASLVDWGIWAAMWIFLLLSLPVQAKYGGGSGTGKTNAVISS